MNKVKIYKNSKDEWYTPKWLVDMFGKFDLDPATSQYNLKRLNIPKGFTKKQNGLKQKWYGKVWLNPPFSDKVKFIEKALKEIKRPEVEYIYMLLPMSFETKYFHKLFDKGIKLYIPKGRIAFETENGTAPTPPFGSCVVKIEKSTPNEIFTFKRGK